MKGEENDKGRSVYCEKSYVRRNGWGNKKLTIERKDHQLPKKGKRDDMERPKIVCLCGSTRFTKEMLIKQWELTKQGYIILSWCALPDDYCNGTDRSHIAYREGVKKIVDEGHKRKIDLADEVLVINIDGYIGESTRSEIEYAREHGKTVRYLEEDPVIKLAKKPNLPTDNEGQWWMKKKA